jgi:hypothetical protein
VAEQAVHEFKVLVVGGCYSAKADLFVEDGVVVRRDGLGRAVAG